MMRGSITFRLSLLFALTTIALLAGISAFLYHFLDNEMMQRDHEELIGKVELFRHQLSTVDTLSQIQTTPNEFRDVIIGHPYLHLTLMDKTGNVLLASGERFPNLKPLKQPVAVDAVPLSTDIQMPTQNRPYHMVAAWGALGEGAGEQALIVLSLDARETQALLVDYRRALFAAILFGGLSAAALGFFVARNGLRPLRQMAVTASNISASHLEHRLAEQNVPQELRVLATTFNAMLERLRDSFSRLSDFSSDLAHELRTPINNLMGQSQVVLSRVRNAEEYRNVLESNLEEYDRLARMIGDMLFLAKADNTRAPLHVKKFDLRAELDKVTEFYEVLAEEAHLDIVCEGEGSVAADPIMAQRAIANLISNAIRHSPHGGIIHASITSLHDNVTLRISNPGHGIPDEHLARVFDRFYQVDDARERSDAGTGLGLAIVKSIMRLHGGDVSVVSELGKETAFTLQFPNNSIQTHKALE